MREISSSFCALRRASTTSLTAEMSTTFVSPVAVPTDCAWPALTPKRRSPVSEMPATPRLAPSFFCSEPSYFTEKSAASRPSVAVKKRRSPAGEISRLPSSPGAVVTRRTRR